MNKNFMIGFMYEGYFYCANVHRYHSITPEYHVTILANKLREGIPSRLILKENGDKAEAASHESISPALVNIILEEIEKHSSAN